MNSLQPQVIASRYRVLRELGRGGMGVVYLVEHVHTGDHVALKLLLGDAVFDAGAVERFKREARASARIKSENVVKVIDADTAPELGNAPFLVMELLNGSDLEQQLEERSRFAPADALKYLTEAARALDKSHAIGIVHRDLKPANLFLHTREDGATILKILDFGISKVVGSEGANDMTGAGMTSTGTVMGTPLYMSPEQARGRVAQIGPATDVWAMGLIAMQLLTGEVYWQANTVAELMSQILAEPLYPPTARWSSLPPAMDAWFSRSCAREPALRFARVGEQMEALGEALGLRIQPGAISQPQLPAPPLAATVAMGESSANLHAVTPPRAMRVLGAHTTTGAVAQDGTRPATRTGSMGAAVAAVVGVLVIGVVGSGAWLVRAQMRAPFAAQNATSTTSAPPLAVPAATASEPASATSRATDALIPAVDAGVSSTPLPATSAVAVIAKSRGTTTGPHKPPVAAIGATAADVPTPGPKKPFAPTGL